MGKEKKIEENKKLKKIIANQKKEVAKLKKLIVKDKIGFNQILRETRDYYENIIAKMPGHVYWLDKNNVYLGCNDLQATHVGLSSRKEIIGKTNYDLFPKSQASELNRINKKVMKTGRLHEVEEFANMSTGPGIYLSQKVPLRNNENKIIGILGISFDITSKKEAEELKLKHNIAEEKAHIMKMLAGSIAHELRTPLATISLYVQNLEFFLPDLIQTYASIKSNLENQKISVRQLHQIEKIPSVLHQTVQTCSQIINMLLMNIREAKLNREDFTLCTIKQDVQNALSEYVFEKKQQELIHVDLKNNFRYYGISLLTKHVLFNLLRNALYYIKVAGKGEIQIILAHEKNENQVIFKDTAKGIPQKFLNTIFDRFVSHRHGGTGLGLAFCKMVMQAYNGDITVWSRSGKFTEFVLHFPKPKDFK